MDRYLFDIISRMKYGEKKIYISFFTRSHLNFLKNYIKHFEFFGVDFFIIDQNVYKLTNNKHLTYLELVGSLNEVKSRLIEIQKLLH